MELERLIRSIEDSPAGDSTVAFFDMDGTVLAGFTAFVFAQERLKKPGRADLDVAAVAFRYQLGNADFTELIIASARALGGQSTHDAVALANRLFRSTIAGLIYPESRALMAAHRNRGHRVVLLSAATDLQVGPVASDLGVDTVLCNRLGVDDHGILTGRVVEPIIYGQGKARAATAYAAEHGLALADAFFYSDGAEDLPLLDEVGHPQPLNPDKRLARAARQRGWSTPTFDSRGRPRPGQLARTVLAQSSVVPSVAAGLFAGAVNRDLRQGLNLAISAWGDFSVALAGVRVDLTGEEHLWSDRPCVFLFNHQSNFDGLLMMKLLRRDVTAVAKKEVRLLPVVGAVFALGDVIFIDRSDHDGAVAALDEAADRVRQGLSVAIAPEGTRQPSPRLGTFKKGAFHLARTAGVPLVPIVIHNSLDVLPRGSKVMRPATVRVEVLDPVPTSDWAPGDIGYHCDEVRRRYLVALGQEAG
jgi:putative phosphoserine phosphatase / 1-acylglycerol-3-phosphate O-acyltransferase